MCLLDIDEFKTVNDTLGHQQGDRLLELTADALREQTRAEDVLARLGGDEFAVLMPETAGRCALDTLERIRAAIAAAGCAAGMQITVSAGACDLTPAADRHELLALADAALYWSKAHGRDRACLHDPAVVRPLSPGERGEQLARSQALASARSPAGVPDAVLLKNGRLDAAEYAIVKRHAALGAEIVDDVLDAEQVSWVRGHHERPDGRGYPDGLRDNAIPDGAALLALADSYDAMTANRSPSRCRPRRRSPRSAAWPASSAAPRRSPPSSACSRPDRGRERRTFLSAPSSAPVRIGIDARAAVRPELGGVERWARELSARLPALRPDRYAVLAPPRALSHRAGHAWEQAWLPVRARRAGFGALLCPANLAPLRGARTIVVIHDAAVLRHPGWYSGLYARWQRAVLPRVARAALHVITVSEFSRAELRELLDLPAERISVVPGGVDAAFAPDPAAAAAARAELGLERPYVLCVASHTARKNLGALLPLSRALEAEGIEVAVAGGHRPQFAAEAGLDPLRLLGHVPDARLPGLYAGAEAFVLPSVYEGFGLPVLEAMAAGTPVVAADAAALPETCGGAARLAAPDGDAIAEAVMALLADGAERERLRAAGRARAAAFSWDRTARAVDAVVERVA